jgi:hypothetical protein
VLISFTNYNRVKCTNYSLVNNTYNPQDDANLAHECSEGQEDHLQCPGNPSIPFVLMPFKVQGSSSLLVNNTYNSLKTMRTYLAHVPVSGMFQVPNAK